MNQDSLVYPAGKKSQLRESISGKLISGKTEMFREPVCFQVIQQDLIPYLATFQSLSIWHAGCSTGEEAYSMAILLKQAELLSKSIIFATDTYEHRLLQGKAGRYSVEKYDSFQNNYKKAGLIGDPATYISKNPGYLQVRSDLIDAVNFFQHDLVSGGSFNSFTCIFCRNVLIYYTPEVRTIILNKLLQSLVPNGFLILGEVEDLRFSPIASQLKRLNEHAPIYQKITQ